MKLLVAWILIVRRILEERSNANGNQMVEFELVRGNDEAMGVEDQVQTLSNNVGGPLRRSNTGSTTLYDSKEGTYAGGEEKDNVQRAEPKKTDSKLVGLRFRRVTYFVSAATTKFSSLTASSFSAIASSFSCERSWTQGSGEGECERFCRSFITRRSSLISPTSIRVTHFAM